jgi:hypothetical protein
MNLRLKSYKPKDDDDEKSIETYTPKKFSWDEEEEDSLNEYLNKNQRHFDLDNIKKDERIVALKSRFIDINHDLSIGMVDNDFTVIILNKESKKTEHFIIDVKDSVIEDITLRLLKDARIIKYLR